MLLCIKLCIKHLQEDEYKKCDITDSLSRLCCFICTLNRATAPLKYNNAVNCQYVFTNVVRKKNYAVNKYQCSPLPSMLLQE